MRVISGEAKGRTIKTLKGLEVRPTSDLVREALFNILAPYLEGAVFLDLFAGSGGVGIEALSRGAKAAVFIDQNPQCVKIIKENLLKTGLEAKSVVHKADSLRFLSSPRCEAGSFNIIYIDPPYQKELADQVLKLIDERGLLAGEGWAVVEHFHKTILNLELKNMQLFKERRFGATKLSFFIHTLQSVNQGKKEEE